MDQILGASQHLRATSGSIKEPTENMWSAGYALTELSAFRIRIGPFTDISDVHFFDAYL